MTRLKASSAHLVISLLVGSVLFAMFWFVWYPAPMLTSIGGSEIFLVVVAIDIVLGPLLTLVVFKHGKPSLKFDLTIIVLMQIAAMAYGVFTLFEARPVFVAALDGEFQVVQAPEVSEANLTKANVKLPLWGPVWVGTKAPDNPYDMEEVKDAVIAGAGRGHFPHLHVAYESVQGRVLSHAKQIKALKNGDAKRSSEVDQWLRRRGYDDKSAVFLPIRISASLFVVMLDARTGKVIGIAPFVPL